MFPDDDTCLAHLFFVRYGPDYPCERCGELGKWHRLSKMPAYTCNCGHHIHPMAGTPFLRTRTPLQKWFYAMFLFTTTRNGVAAKELQRQLGVTYKTAWRMAKEIRVYMAWVDGDASAGGPWRSPSLKPTRLSSAARIERGEDDKTVVLGMVERGGEVVTRVIPDRSAPSVIPHIKKWVRQGRAHRDRRSARVPLAWRARLPPRHCEPHREGIRARRCHTNTIEAFWAMVKRTIAGTHIWVSPKHLPKYLGGDRSSVGTCGSTRTLMFPVLFSAFARPFRLRHCREHALEALGVAFRRMLFGELLQFPGAARFFKAEMFTARH